MVLDSSRKQIRVAAGTGRQKALAAHTVAATSSIQPVGAACSVGGRSLGQVKCLCEGDCYVTAFRREAAGSMIYCLLQVRLPCKAAVIRLYVYNYLFVF